MYVYEFFHLHTPHTLLCFCRINYYVITIMILFKIISSACSIAIATMTLPIRLLVILTICTDLSSSARKDDLTMVQQGEDRQFGIPTDFMEAFQSVFEEEEEIRKMHIQSHYNISIEKLQSMYTLNTDYYGSHILAAQNIATRLSLYPLVGTASFRELCYPYVLDNRYVQYCSISLFRI